MIGKVYTQDIDKDKTTETPGLVRFPHHVGSAVIRPEDKGKIKSRALTSMRQQTDRQLSQLYRQAQLLAEQAREIQRRVEVSERIYAAEMGFEPIPGHIYFLYQKKSGGDLVSMVSPEEWGKNMPFECCIARMTLLADHTWEVETTNVVR